MSARTAAASATPGCSLVPSLMQPARKTTSRAARSLMRSKTAGRPGKFPPLPLAAEIGAVALEPFLEAFHVQPPRRDPRLEGERRCRARRLPHDEAGARDPRRGLPLVGHGG